MWGLFAWLGCDAADGTKADGPSEAAAAKSANGAAIATASIELGPREHRPAASKLDAAGRPATGPHRGAVAWRPPAHWTARRDAGKPFILGEYALKGHTEERPALCRLLHNSGWSSTKTDEEQAISEAKRTRLRDDEGKSLLSKLEPKTETLGNHGWTSVFAQGRYREPGSFGNVPVEDLLPGYAQMNLIPQVAGTRLALRCWAPAETLEGEVEAMRAWAATLEYPASE